MNITWEGVPNDIDGTWYICATVGKFTAYRRYANYPSCADFALQCNALVSELYKQVDADKRAHLNAADLADALAWALAAQTDCPVTCDNCPVTCDNCPVTKP